jgi:large subunit ribosomal protein L14e
MVNEPSTRRCVGQVVQVTQGRDAEKFAIVIGQVNDKFVLIADGDKRKFDRPKKKNVLHLEFVEYVSEEVQKSLLDTGRVSNGKLRFALNKFLEEHSEVPSKGE